MQQLSLDKRLENECLRLASVFGKDDLGKRKIILHPEDTEEFENVFLCLGVEIPIEYSDEVDTNSVNVMYK